MEREEGGSCQYDTVGFEDGKPGRIEARSSILAQKNTINLERVRGRNGTNPVLSSSRTDGAEIDRQIGLETRLAGMVIAAFGFSTHLFSNCNFHLK